MAAASLKSHVISGERGEFEVYISNDDIEQLKDEDYALKFYQQISKSQECDVDLTGKHGILTVRCTPYELEKVKSDPIYADILYRKCLQMKPRGPLRNFIPKRYHQYLSDQILNAYLTSTYEEERQIYKENPNASTVIVKTYSEKLYNKVEEHLNELGKMAITEMDAWLMNTLIDEEEFDKIICDMPEVPEVLELAQNNSVASNDLDTGDTDMTPCSDSVEDVEHLHVWSTPRVTSSNDRRALYCLINLVGSAEMQQKLKDKKTKKKTVWKEIGEKLKQKGFTFAVDDVGEKVHQKWRNIEREYRSFIENSKTTGAGKKKKPEFFDELDKFLSSKHSINPVSIVDTSADEDINHNKCPSPKKSILAMSQNTSPSLHQSTSGVSQNTPPKSPAIRNSDVEIKKSEELEDITRNTKKKRSSKNEIITAIKDFQQESKHQESLRFGEQMKFLNDLKTEMKQQHEDRMKATLQLIEVLKNNS